MTRNTATSRALLVLVAGAFLASCSDTGPVSGPVDITPAMSVQDVDFTGDHILSVSRGQFGRVSSAIVSLGGSIVRSHDEVGIIIASGLSDDAVAALQDTDGVQALVADIAIQGDRIAAIGPLTGARGRTEIDVEGMEEEVVRGAAETITRLKPVLYCECDRADKAESLIRFIDSLGYVMFWHLPPLYHPENFTGNPTNVFDNIVSSNILCVDESMAGGLSGFEKVEIPRAA